MEKTRKVMLGLGKIICNSLGLSVKTLSRDSGLSIYTQLRL